MAADTDGEGQQFVWLVIRDMQEDLDYNKLNEWLQTQAVKGNSLFG